MSKHMIFDRNLKREVDLLYLCLVYTDMLSVVPDLYRILRRICYSELKDYVDERIYKKVAKEILTDLLDKFKGSTVRFPTSKQVDSAFRDVSIYIRMKDVEDDLVKFSLKRDTLASEYGVSSDYIMRIYKKVSDVLENNFDFVSLEGLQSDE